MDFRGDERGQPVVIGALLVFVILILAFSGYQAFVVPNQNADVEFQHSQDVQDDMVDLRVGIVDAAISGSDTSTSVQLGTQYPSRLLALNPPPPAGTLRTTEPGDIVVDGQAGNNLDVCPAPETTRAFVYSPEYNEFQNGADLVYENTVAYSQHDDDETREIIKTTPRLVDLDAGVIELVALEGEFSESGTQRVAVDLIHGGTNSQNVQNPEITLPTRIENEETWKDILEGDPNIVEFNEGVSITFQYNEQFEVRCTPVGVNRAPESSAAGGGGGGNGGGGGTGGQSEN